MNGPAVFMSEDLQGCFSWVEQSDSEDMPT